MGRLAAPCPAMLCIELSMTSCTVGIKSQTALPLHSNKGSVQEFIRGQVSA